MDHEALVVLVTCCELFLIISHPVFSHLLALSAGKCVRLSFFLFPMILTLCWCAVETSLSLPLKTKKRKNFTHSSRWQITFVELVDVKFPLQSEAVGDLTDHQEPCDLDLLRHNV